MSTDWNQKLAWVLRDLPDTEFDLLHLSEHRAELLGGADVGVDVGSRGDWLVSSADRVPFPKGKAGARVQVDWGAHPEVTHPVAKQRYTCDAVDLDAAARGVGDLLREAAGVLEGDARRILLWMWRYLPERLAAAEGGPGPVATFIPADPRLPNLSVWKRLAFDAALAGAGTSPSFLVVQALPAEESTEETVTLQDLWADASIATELMWHAMLPVLEMLGPEAILTPSMDRHPKIDAWLEQQGVVPGGGLERVTQEARLTGTLPNLFVALVPADRARELGEACKAAYQDAWSKMASQVRDHLAKNGWADAGDEGWTSLWSRQSAHAWEVSWTAVAWAEDSTGSGSLLSKQEVTVLEKWARVQEDAAGLEEPWPGIYYGLWRAASLGAAAARRGMGEMSVLCEPHRLCTSCGYREALHAGSGGSTPEETGAFWRSVVGKADHLVHEGEALCAVCTSRRMAASAGLLSAPSELKKIADEQGSYALILFGLDDGEAILRGGKDLKQAATLADGVHSGLSKTFTKRARSHVREILDTVAPIGPARQMGVQHAEQDFLFEAVPSLLARFGATALRMSTGELMLAAPVDKAYPLVHALRATCREAFVELPSSSGKRLGMHFGPQSSTSAVVAIVPSSERVGSVVRDCRRMLDDTARASLGGDALVVMKRTPGAEEQRYAAHWGELTTSFDVLLEGMGNPADRERLVAALTPVAAALSNADIDKPSSAARPALVKSVLRSFGDTHGGDAPVDDEAIARAVCQMVDHCVRLSHGVVETRTLDGVRVAASLCGVDR